MNFMTALEKNEKSITENGALGYKTAGHSLVDLNFAIPSFRSDGIDKDLFDNAYQEDRALTLKWLLYLRDIRQGVGERQSFRDYVEYLYTVDSDVFKRFIYYVDIEEYGRWDDIIDILFELKSDKDVVYLIIEKVKNQISSDLENIDNNKSISLIGKWLPSENASSHLTRSKAKYIRGLLGYTSKEYRKLLSKLRKYIDVVEVKMSANKWENIKYESVPSKANLIYSNAFFKHDTDRRSEYLINLAEGKTKINANVLFLHDIVSKYKRINYIDNTLEALWKAQDKVEGFSDTLVVRDGSGSMYHPIGDYRVSHLRAEDVADAITLYCAENNSGVFKNKFITFSSHPAIVSLVGKKSLYDRLVRLSRENDCSNTDIESVFNLILSTAIKNKCKQEELPKTILIVSDMEFDDATTLAYHDDSDWETLFEGIERKFKENGYNLPKLVFWNVNSRTNTIPCTQNDNGVILLSGFSKNLMRMVMSSELDPYRALVAILNSDRYSIIDTVVS